MNFTGQVECTSSLSQFTCEKGQAASRKRKSDSCCNSDNSPDDPCEKKTVCNETDTIPDSCLPGVLTPQLYSPLQSPDFLIKQLTKDLKSEEERLRKLKMVKTYREKNNLEELEELICKWRNVCQESLQDLQEKISSPRPTLKQLLDHLQIEHNLVHFDPDADSFL